MLNGPSKMDSHSVFWHFFRAFLATTHCGCQKTIHNALWQKGMATTYCSRCIKLHNAFRHQRRLRTHGGANNVNARTHLGIWYLPQRILTKVKYDHNVLWQMPKRILGLNYY